MTRPRGKPPTPSAASSDRHPLGITLTGTSTSRLPSRMIEPLPYDFSICDIAASSNFCFSSAISHLGRGNRNFHFTPGDGDFTKHKNYHSVAPPATPFSGLPSATVRHFMIRKPRLSCLFPLIQRCLFPVSQMPQPGQIPAPRAGLEKLLFQLLALLTA